MPVIFAFEGIDSSGKQTQADRLAEYLRKRGLVVGVVSYPAYDGFVGKEIGKMLSGADFYPTMLDLDPKSAAMWYAMDRVEDFSKRYMYLSTMDYIIFNRWTRSNQAFQAARVTDHMAMIQWIDDLEHRVLVLPRPNYYIQLVVDVDKARENTAKKGDRGYTSVADVHERNMSYQQAAQEMYLAAAATDKNTPTLMIPFGTVDQVHQYVLNALQEKHVIPGEPIYKMV